MTPSGFESYPFGLLPYDWSLVVSRGVDFHISRILPRHESLDAIDLPDGCNFSVEQIDSDKAIHRLKGRVAVGGMCFMVRLLRRDSLVGRIRIQVIAGGLPDVHVDLGDGKKTNLCRPVDQSAAMVLKRCHLTALVGQQMHWKFRCRPSRAYDIRVAVPGGPSADGPRTDAIQGSFSSAGIHTVALTVEGNGASFSIPLAVHVDGTGMRADDIKTWMASHGWPLEPSGYEGDESSVSFGSVPWPSVSAISPTITPVDHLVPVRNPKSIRNADAGHSAQMVESELWRHAILAEGFTMADRYRLCLRVTGHGGASLAKEMMVLRKTIDRWSEARSPRPIPPEHIPSLAQALGVDPTWLRTGILRKAPPWLVPFRDAIADLSAIVRWGLCANAPAELFCPWHPSFPSTPLAWSQHMIQCTNAYLGNRFGSHGAEAEAGVRTWLQGEGSILRSLPCCASIWDQFDHLLIQVLRDDPDHEPSGQSSP